MPETPAEYNEKIIAEFRAHEGHVGGQWEGTPLLLLHHLGSRTGVRRVNPLAYLPDDSSYLIWAANGGAPQSPAWYYNLKANPSTTIEVGNTTTDVVAEEALPSERDRLYAQATDRYPQLRELAQKSERVIPFMVLTPMGTSSRDGPQIRD
jgi:deazaflavin-dependent oxidoreductase (nitroreductase family)